MAFKAQDELDPLAYNFNPYADVVGTSPEPSDKQINNYFDAYGRMLRINRDKLQEFDDRRDALKSSKEPSTADALRALDEEYEAWRRENADDNRTHRQHLLAELLSNQPTVDEMAQLPGRLFGLYESSVQEDMTPKRKGSDTND